MKSSIPFAVTGMTQSPRAGGLEAALTPVGSGPSSALLPTQSLHLLEESPDLSTSRTGCVMPIILSKSLQGVSAWESAVVDVPLKMLVFEPH